MTAHVTIENFRNQETDWRGRPLGRVGDAVTVVVKLWDYANLKGGRFSIKHPAMAPEGEEFDVPARRATGDRKVLGVLGKHKTTPEDLSHEDTIDCVVHLTRDCDGYEPFTLTALQNCVTEPAPEATLRCVATQTLFEAARVTVRSGVRGNTEERYDVARAGNKGLPSTIGNTIRACVRLFATLRFKDPDGVERPFPKGTPVKVLLGDHPDHAIDAGLDDDGKLSLEVIGHASVVSAKTLTLRLGADSKNRVICELPGDPKTQRRGSEPGETDPTGTRDARFFTLPKEWTLREADWEVTNDDGRWVADPAHFKMTVGGRAASLGKVDSPVKLVLDPHWQFLKFEFLDRRYGHGDHADERKTVPPMVIEGFRYKPTKSSTKPDVRSNWWVVEGDDTIQCVPWILQRNPNGTARKRPSGQTLLRFELPAKTCIHSESATKRTRVIATDEQLKPGPARLDFYDLPEAWNSRNYYAKLSASPHEFGWYEQVASKPSSKAKPLTFSLDDIVLTDDAGRRLATWTHDDRLAIFAHTFDDTLSDTSKEGVYKPDDGAKLPWYTTKPASGAPEENENYVVDHPGWTRLIAAQGNLFDVFDRRTVASSPADLDYDVIGARAAVCWVDTTKQIGAATMWEPDPSDPDNYVQETSDHRPSPGRYFKGAGVPAMSDHGSMAVQPYYSQDYMDRFGKYLDAGSTGSIGRFDMALLRCCGVADVDGKPTELALNLWFHRLCFDATIAPVGTAIDAYQVAFVRNVLDRFNGLDAKNDQKRAELLPKDAAKPLKVSVMTFMQVTPEAEAHFRIVLTDSTADARDWRQGVNGTGETANSAPEDSGTVDGFVNAHEHGHQSALPDEYNERWDAASFGQPSFYSTLPGDPFELDGRTKEFQEDNSPLMNGNHALHNRYFWQAAEWVRLVVRTGMKVKLGTKYADYWLPPYPATDETRRHYAFWPLSPSANDVALPARAPLTANRGKVDLYLYAIGADAFALKTLPSREDPPATDPYDGILMVTVRVKLQAWGVSYEKEKDLKKLAQAIALAPRRFDAPKPRKLNHAWIFKGTHGKGTPQEWAFKRCLVHFSPRLLVSAVTEIKKLDDWRNDLGEFKDEAIWTAVESKITEYHAIDWTHTDKAAKLDALVGPSAEPTIEVRGSWARNGAPEQAINAALTQYGTLPDAPVLDRYNAVQTVRDECDAWLNEPTNSGFAQGPANGLRTRAEAARKKLGALFYVRELEEQAKALKERRAKHEATVTEVANAHAPHFTVNCKAGSPVAAEWDPIPLEGDLPEVAAWENLVPPAHRTGAVFNRIKGLLTKYKSKEALDLPGRISALADMIGPAVIAPEPSPRGTWTTRARASLTTIDTQLTAFESADPENHDLRQESVVGAQAIAVAVPDMDDTDGTDATDAAALVTRTDATLDLLRFRRQVRSLEGHAARFKAHLDRWVISTTCTLTADSPAGFEEAFLLAFPSMIGAYKSASKIEVADVRAIVSSLTVDDLRVVDLLDS